MNSPENAPQLPQVHNPTRLEINLYNRELSEAQAAVAEAQELLQARQIRLTELLKRRRQLRIL